MLNLDKIKTNTAFFGYVYKIRFTHPETKEIYYYIGKKESSFVDETYWGSSLILNNLIKKYSVSCVSREIIATAHTREELSFLELLIIKQHSENYKTCLLNIKGNSNYTNNSLINESILRIKSKKPFNQDEIFF